MEILIITIVVILIVSLLLFRDEAGDIFKKIAESKYGFLYILMTLITISAVIIIQANNG